MYIPNSFYLLANFSRIVFTKLSNSPTNNCLTNEFQVSALAHNNFTCFHTFQIFPGRNYMYAKNNQHSLLKPENQPHDTQTRLNPDWNWINYSYETQFQFLLKPLETTKFQKKNLKHNNLFLIKWYNQRQKREKHLIKKIKKLDTKKRLCSKRRWNCTPSGLFTPKDVLSMLFSRPNPPRFNHAYDTYFYFWRELL